MLIRLNVENLFSVLQITELQSFTETIFMQTEKIYWWGFAISKFAYLPLGHQLLLRVVDLYRTRQETGSKTLWQPSIKNDTGAKS